MKKLKFIDLFAGIGGIRLGFETAAKKLGYSTECVLTSEIKEQAIFAYKANFKENNIYGDITKISIDEIPNFDFLLAGFPCQAFSSAGNRKGFADTRGTLFFEIQRIIKDKKPMGFLLENVEGLVTHNKEKATDKIGKTLNTILNVLKELGYKVSWQVFNAVDFGVPQNRKRIYIVGTKNDYINIDIPIIHNKILEDILEKGLPCMDTKFTKKLLSLYSIENLYGKSIKDKRGGDNNIHSWDLELKGKISLEQKELLEKLLRERRKKKWAEKKNIKWMDGMPLTLAEIKTFYCKDDLFSKTNHENLKYILDDLVNKGYLKYEHPKELISKIDSKEQQYSVRQKDSSKEKGYNIVSGKLSFEITKILDPKDVAPTIVAMDSLRLAVIDNGKLRRLSIREGLRLFGYPEEYDLDIVSYKDAFDLLGNTVVVPVIESVSKNLIKTSLP